MSRPSLLKAATSKCRLLVALPFLALLLWAHCHYRLALVVGESMRPGLKTGDLLLIDKRAYANSDPRRGDVVLARHEHDLIIKRVVGLPGEEVALHLGHLQINGVPLAEEQKMEPGRLEILPGRLFPGRFALLGDNRAVGPFQIVHAVVKKDQVIGKVVGTLCWWKS